ncbi:hypothetical protein NDU88_000926 [Pleurodeles waltl]|uniref:Uncharacterized protein n=1 Tax=Pleurodeles waltl TaxID=8319 RepID=A0AAV7VAD6_PLEWA|nr:hypothetical protein NDU88_000926 [Pleurodeles waltl]
MDSSENGYPSAQRRGWGGSHLTIEAPDPGVQPRLGSRQAAEDCRKTRIFHIFLKLAQKKNILRYILGTV